MPGSSGESLMSQNWPDLIAEICSCFGRDYKNMCVCSALDPVRVETLNLCLTGRKNTRMPIH